MSSRRWYSMKANASGSSLRRCPMAVRLMASRGKVMEGAGGAAGAAFVVGRKPAQAFSAGAAAGVGRNPAQAFSAGAAAGAGMGGGGGGAWALAGATPAGGGGGACAAGAAGAATGAGAGTPKARGIGMNSTGGAFAAGGASGAGACAGILFEVPRPAPTGPSQACTSSSGTSGADEVPAGAFDGGLGMVAARC